ncbi:MAG: rhodanese-like domain-containing protein [Gammaproteobacteria bacterium]|jgi:rhodanese-related sulfurtransferase|nr:rhodanese-like domain-containing protein [Gammaproteobacteria bacterium]MBT7307088.1 rhodanese-like domain-containing protein [Gammaproteobacteria bacterium]
MNHTKLWQPLLFTLTIGLSPPLLADHQAVEALEEYMAFAPYAAGAISSEQLEHEGYRKFFIVDTRNQGQYQQGHLPGAINIEWREILSQRDQLPAEQPILLYCETGLLSSKAHLALNVAGFDNVKVLWGGYIIWSARQTFEDTKQPENVQIPR